MTLRKAIGYLIASAVMVVVLSGCVAKSATTSIDRASGTASTIGQIFQQIGYHAEQAEKELGK